MVKDASHYSTFVFQENDQCECNSIISIFHDTNQKLLKMDLLERLTSNVVTQIVHNHIKKHVQVFILVLSSLFY